MTNPAKTYRRALRQGLVCEVREQQADEAAIGGWHTSRRILGDWGAVLGYVDTLRVKSEQEPMEVSMTIHVKRF